MTNYQLELNIYNTLKDVVEHNIREFNKNHKVLETTYETSNVLYTLGYFRREANHSYDVLKLFTEKSASLLEEKKEELIKLVIELNRIGKLDFKGYL